jgi:PAS domain S-box-containing protein
MMAKVLTISLAEQEIKTLESYCQQFALTESEVIKDYLRLLNQPSNLVERKRSKEQLLLLELATLRQELETVKQEKTTLEKLLETTTQKLRSGGTEFLAQDERKERSPDHTEEQFRLVLEAAPVPVIVSRTSDGTILYANPSAGSIVGLSCQDLLARSAKDFYDDISVRQQLLDTIAKEGAVHNYELLLRRADGTEFWVSASFQSLLFNGEPTILSVLCDITDRKQAEKALSEKEVLLQLVLDNIPQLIFWKDRNSTFLGSNRRWAAAAGLNHPKDVIGKTDENVYKKPPNKHQQPPKQENIDYYREQDRRVLSTGQSELHFVEHKRKADGQEVWYETNKIPIQDSEGTIVGILGTIEDITERKQAEEALRIAEENYRSIFENALEGIFQSTPDGHYICVNPAMARIHGYESPEEMMASIKEIERQVYVDPNYRHKFKRLIEQRGKVKNFEYQIYHKDGSVIWVEEDTRAVCDAAGRLLYYEGIVRDITQRKQEEDTLKRQVEELQIEIDQQKRVHQVAAITQADYFQDLQAELKNLRFEDDF